MQFELNSKVMNSLPFYHHRFQYLKLNFINLSLQKPLYFIIYYQMIASCRMKSKFSHREELNWQNQIL